MQTEDRNRLLETIRKIVDELSTNNDALKIVFFRGDSFQILIKAPENAMKIAILLRAGLRSHKSNDLPQKQWDTRLSLGVGFISYDSEYIELSDGEAFQYSGRELDEIGKRRLIVKTRWENVNEELQVSTAFADMVISSWTIPQSQAAYQKLLYNISQKDIASKFQKSAQTINRSLNTAKVDLIQMYINRYQNLISNSIKNESSYTT